MIDDPAAFDATGGLLTASGAVDELSVDNFAEALKAFVARNPGQDLRVDLSGVTFFPSRAIGALATAMLHAKKAGGSLSVLAVDGSFAARVLAITGIPVDTGARRQSRPSRAEDAAAGQ